MLWRVELRKHLPVTAAAAVATVATGAAAALAPEVVSVAVLHSLCILLCWSAVVCASAGAVFNFLVLGRDQLLQISTRSRWALAGMKLVVLAGLLVLLHLVTLAVQVPALRDAADAAGTALGGVLAAVVVSKVVSVCAFLLSTAALAVLAKTMPGRATATVFYTVALIVVVVGQAVALWQLGAPTTRSFFIGVGGELTTVNLYANILPLTLTSPAEGIIPPIWGLSVALNLGSAALFGALWAVMARVRRYNFLPC